MIQEFVEIWDSNKNLLEKKYSQEHPDSYSQIVFDLIHMLHDNSDEYEKPDPDRVTTINHGDYQGYLLWIVGATGYQPSKYWAASSYYGSCGGCDTYQAIRDRNYNWDDSPIKDQTEAYMTLALHLLQSFREI